MIIVLKKINYFFLIILFFSLKGFATSLAIILSCIVSIYAFDFHLSIQFTLGAALVIGSLFLFNKPLSK